MNAHTSFTAEVATQPWHHTPEAQTLLASCAADEPRIITVLAPLATRMAGGDEYIPGYDRRDARVDALIRLSDKAWHVACAAARSQEERTSLTLALPRVDEVIASVVAGQKVAA